METKWRYYTGVKSEGAVIIEIFRIFGSIFLSDNDVNKKLDNVDKKASGVSKTLGNMAKGFDKAGSSLSKLGRDLSVGLTAPLVAVGAGIIKLATGAADYADEVGLMAEKTGLSIKNVQELRYVTNQLDVEFSTIQTSITAFTNQLKTTDSESSNASQALQRLGISMKNANGSTKDMSILYTEVIKKLSGVENETDRNILASSLFGRSYSELIPILNAGSDEIERLTEEANKLGLIMSDESIISAREFGDAWDRVKMQFGAVFREIGMSFIPLLQDKLIPFIQNQVVPVFHGLANSVENVVTWFSNLSPSAQNVIGALLLIAAATGPLISIFSKISTTISGLIAVLQFVISPIGLIIIGVAALAAVAFLLIKNWNKVPPFFKALWEFIKLGFARWGVVIQLNLRQVQYALAKFLDFTAGNLMGSISSLLELMSRIPGVGDVFTGAANSIGSLQDKIKNFVENSRNDLDTAIANEKEAGGRVADAWGNAMDKLGDIGQGMKDTVLSAVDSVKGIFKNGFDEVKQKSVQTVTTLGETVEDATEKVKKAYEKFISNLRALVGWEERAYDKRIETLDSFGAAVVKALTNQYNEQRKAQEKALNKELDGLKTAHETKMKLYDEEYNAKRKTIEQTKDTNLKKLQSDIDALNALTDAEERALKEQEYQTKLSNLNKQVLEATSLEERLEALKEIDDLKAEHEREAALESRELQIKTLQEQMDAIEEAAEKEAAALEETYDLKKETAEKELEDLEAALNARMEKMQEHYDQLLEEESLNAEARQLLMNESNAQMIQDLLTKYNPEWQNVGQSFGESLVMGLNSMATSMKDAIRKALGLVPDEAETANQQMIDTLQELAQRFADLGNEEGKLYTEALIAKLRAGATVVNAETVAMVANMDKIFQILNYKLQYAVAKTQAEKDAISAAANQVRATMPADVAALVGSNVSIEQMLQNVQNTIAAGLGSTSYTGNATAPVVTGNATAPVVTGSATVTPAESWQLDHYESKAPYRGIYHKYINGVKQSGWKYGPPKSPLSATEQAEYNTFVANHGQPIYDTNFYASGTPSARRGWALVGEEGPELVKFHGGETVKNARDTAKARGVTLNIYCNRPSDIKEATREGEMLVNRLRTLGGVT